MAQDICYYLSLSENADKLNIFLLNGTMKKEIFLEDILSCEYTVQQNMLPVNNINDIHKTVDEEYLMIEYSEDDSHICIIFQTKPLQPYEFYNEVAQRNVNLVEYINERIS